jgi:hypothetical protein
MIVGLVVGFAIAQIRQMYTADVINDFGSSMNSSKQFEMALTDNFEYKGQKHPYFKDLTAYPLKHRDRWTYVVTGMYCPGRPERKANGGGAFVYRPSCFIQEKPVYKPVMDLKTLNKPGGPDYAARWSAIANPTVIDFLNIMHEAKGVNYRYAWWAEPKKSLMLWMATGLVVIGGIWPFLVNLIAFGSLKAPPEEKKVNLRKVKDTSSKTTKAEMSTAAATAADMNEVARMTSNLEEKLASTLTEKTSEDAADEAAAAAAAAAGPGPIKQLTATKLEICADLDKKDDKAFGAGADDFYPTERKGKPNKPV